MKPGKIILIVIGSIVALFVILSIVMVANMSPEEKAKIEQERTQRELQEHREDSIQAVANELVLQSERQEKAKQNVQDVVRSYLRSNLRDASSYEDMEWSEIVELSGGNTFQVRHKYRAANGFGGKNLEDQIFTVSNGQVLNVAEYR